MAKIILTDAEMKMLHSVWSDVQALGELKVTEKDDEDTLVQEVADADLIIICYAAITRRVIGSGKKLKAILKWGVGVDPIDFEAANEHRLPVCHCPHYGSATIADHAFAMLITLARKLVPLVNTTRGALIQEAQLVKALRENRIAGTAIDVFDSEPIDSTHPFYKLDNTLITPHFAYYTVEADDRLDRECLHSARRILNNETLVNVKNGDALAALGEPVRWLPYGELP